MKHAAPRKSDASCDGGAPVGEGRIDLAVLRSRIDGIDAEIVELFERRMRIAADVAAYKRSTGKPVLDREREAARIDAVTRAASDDFKSFMPPLFGLIMEMSREYQHRLLDGHAVDRRAAAVIEHAPALPECCDGGLSRSGRKGTLSASREPVYGLLGRKLAHSYSPKIHELFETGEYRLFEVEPEDVRDFVSSGAFAGLNVTVPYKETVMPLCDELSDAARGIGCVNTIVRREDGTLYGDNTDYYGFSFMIDYANVAVEGKKALVLGAGGASKTVCAVLKDRGAREVAVVSRNMPGAGLDAVRNHYDADIIVNATPVGMYPDCPASLIDLEPFCSTGETREGHRDGLVAVLDVVYNPARTGILLQAEKCGIPFIDGLPMLVAQAKRASEIFRDTHIDDDVMRAVIERVSSDRGNIVLIGMPSSGKSTIGALLAERLGRTFVDIDERIPAAAGKSIPAIFADDGEEAFRRIETAVTGDVCKESGLVVACGGGVVTQPCNYDLLHQNATIVLLRRPIELLVSDGRPMSIAKGIATLEKERRRSYEAWADVAVENDASPEEAVDRIVAALRIEGNGERR
ncbi:MAG: shikimate kinase [Slackia sp.]|nr:shikimate kinase [Slackia sp.]